MPEFGMMFKLNADYDNVEWYGYGPEETYADRRHGAKLGIYKNKAADNMAKYLVPQECGNKVGVRYAKVTDDRGRGLLFSGDELSFSALPYTPQNWKMQHIRMNCHRYIILSCVSHWRRWVSAVTTAGVHGYTRNTISM